jgi:hypothetical protein
MLRRIGFWALCGLAVALIWAAVLYPSQGAVLHYLGHTVLLPVTAPVALLGRHYAITWCCSALINAAIYACVGIAVEVVRLSLRSSSARLRH